MTEIETELLEHPPTAILDNKKCSGLRVLLRAPYPPPYGGIASLIVSLLPGLKDQGVDEVVVLHYGDKNETKLVDGATVYCVAHKSQAWRLLLPWNWKTGLTVISTLKNAKLGIRQIMSEIVKTILVHQLAVRHRSNVVSFYESSCSFELLACRQIWGKSRGIVLTVFGEMYDNTQFITSRPLFYKQLIESPDRVLATSDHCGCSFKKIGVSRPIDVIYVGVDFKRYNDNGSLRNQYRNQLGITEEQCVLLFMGRFHCDMGLDGLIKSIPSLIKNNPTVKIILAGAKGPLDTIAATCERAHPVNVKILQDVPFSLQPSLYAAADIILAPSRDQRACMGVSIKEAMMASKPVVATNSGGIPEAIIDGETGILVPLNTSGDVDDEAFVIAIQALMDNQQRRLEMGCKARKRALDLFTEKVTVQRVADVFMNCLALVIVSPIFKFTIASQVRKFASSQVRKNEIGETMTERCLPAKNKEST